MNILRVLNQKLCGQDQVSFRVENCWVTIKSFIILSDKQKNYFKQLIVKTGFDTEEKRYLIAVAIAVYLIEVMKVYSAIINCNYTGDSNNDTDAENLVIEITQE